MAELRKVVRRGIKLLDERLPCWRKVISLKQFDYEDPCRCVLGTIGSTQLCSTRPGNWYKGMDALNLDKMTDYSNRCNEPNTAIYYGFDWGHYDEAPILARLWTKAIKGERV